MALILRDTKVDGDELTRAVEVVGSRGDAVVKGNRQEEKESYQVFKAASVAQKVAVTSPVSFKDEHKGWVCW